MPIHNDIARLAERAPDRVVLTAGPDRLTAVELDRFANRVAWSLAESGVRPGDLVAVALYRDTTLIPALLGVLKAGAAYVPIDPHLPAARIAAMLDDSGARHVLTTDPDAHGARTCVDPRNLGEAPNHPPPVTVGSEDVAYVIYTSGTTGRPKGVVIDHRSVDNLVRGWATAIPFPAGATMSSLTTVAFDIFLAETILPMLYGLRVALATDGDVGGPTAIAAYLAREEVTVVQATPSRLAWLLADPRMAAELRRVRLLVVGGEAFPPPLLTAARAHTSAAIYNVYGPTEATVWTSAKLLADDEPITVGPPIPGVTYHLAGEDGVEPPTGDLGELLISGAALARGYLGDPTRTADRFGTGDRQFRTGDLARRLAGGEVQIAGRADHQIKIDGYRVELAEIEAVLAATPGVTAAVVVPLSGGPGQTLAGLVTPDTADVDAVWRRAAERLPRYMMPSTLVATAAIPLSPAGKADRRAVETLLRDCIGAATALDPADYLAAEVARWLNHPVDADNGGLLDLGVGSLTTARLAAEIACRYQVHLDLAEMIQAPSLRDLADLVRRRATH